MSFILDMDAPKPPTHPDHIVAVVLAGGAGRRLGPGDKSLTPLAGKPLIDHVLDRVMPQAGQTILSANGDLDRFQPRPLPIIADQVPGSAGPLAGLLAALDWMQTHRPNAPWLLSVPTDTPFLPTDLAGRLAGALPSDKAAAACAASAGRRHPVIALWPVSSTGALRRALTVEAIRKVG
ncbi:MAG: molybdenum cofactor guanylyltransferase MobA, partial [Pseudomonadota bacterium]